MTQLTLELPDDIERYRNDLLDRLFRRLKFGVKAAYNLEFWSCVESIESWCSSALEDKKKIETAPTREALDQLAYNLALTDEFMLPDELE